MGSIDTTNLLFPCRNIEKVSDLNKFTKLVYINLSFNKLTDISCIESCPEIEVLDISYNRITNIECLHSLTKLQKLYV